MVKLEGSAVLNDLVKSLRTLTRITNGDGQGPSASFDFWVNVALRFAQSSSFPLRLFGWDYMEDIIGYKSFSKAEKSC